MRMKKTIKMELSFFSILCRGRARTVHKVTCQECSKICDGGQSFLLSKTRRYAPETKVKRQSQIYCNEQV